MRYLQISLVVIFIFAGIFLAFSEPYPMTLKVSLVVLLAILVLVFGASFLPGKKKLKGSKPAVVEDIEKIGQAAYKKAKRLVILVVGVTVCLVGVLMIALPGPAVVVIPAGLAILASEYAWARRLLRKAKKEIKNISQSKGKKK